MTAGRVLSEHTRMPLGPQTACFVRLTDRIRHLRVKAFRNVQFSVVRGQRALTILAHHATPERLRKALVLQDALSVVLEAMPQTVECHNACHVTQANILQQ